MKTDVENKKFDCVKMKNDIQAKIYKKNKDINVEKMLAFFNSLGNRVVFGK
jgi:hypothetical protein